MDAVKQAVVQALEKQGVLAQLKAQLRAQVFVAVDEYESTTSGSGLSTKSDVPARKQLLAEADGQLVIQLVLDLLDTCNLAFTKKVFQPEIGPSAPGAGRQAAASQLGLKPSSSEEPLLLTLVKAFKSGSFPRTTDSASFSSSATATAAAATTSTPTAAPASAMPTPSASVASSVVAPATTTTAPRPGISAAPLPRLEPLSVSKPALAPLPALGSKSSDPPKPAPTAGLASTKMASSDPPAAPKPAPEASAESAYSSEAFEEEPVEEEVEDEAGRGAGDDDDDDDYATALGFKPSSAGAQKPELGRSGSSGGDGSDGGGKDRLAGGFPSSSRGRTALDADLMAGDRSFGVSNELAGLDTGNSGGLSFSADYGSPDPRASVSSSQAMLSPISEGTPKLGKLEPLRPLGAKLSPLAPLPPLSSSLSSSKEDPLGKGPKPLGMLAAPVRKSLPDIEKEKEELRRLGLLQSGDSLNASMEVEPRGRTNIYDAEMSVSASMDDGAWGGGGGGSGGGARDVPFGSKGLSMDLRETGLSASDRSGDIEQMGADLAETAEWH